MAFAVAKVVDACGAAAEPRPLRSAGSPLIATDERQHGAPSSPVADAARSPLASAPGSSACSDTACAEDMLFDASGEVAGSSASGSVGDDGSEEDDEGLNLRLAGVGLRGVSADG